MEAIRTLYRGENNWDFVSVSRKVMISSAVLVVLCLVSFLARGLNLGIEFDGGAVWEVPAIGDVDEDDISGVMSSEGVDDARVQTITGGDDIFRVRAEVADVSDRESIAGALAAGVGVSIDEVSTRNVSPSFGDEVAGKARRALVVFFVLIALYLTLRFEWRMALGALVAVVHDIAVSVGVYSVFQIEITPATVVAFLTIMGYSLYDTIVVFDRIKENQRALSTRSRVTYEDLANVSLNQVLMRSINTSITSVLPVASMLVVGSVILGATSLQEFAIALLIGIAFGSYSSLFVATPLVVWMKSRQTHWREQSMAAERARTSGSLAEADTKLAADHYTRTAAPRPRKMGKRR